MLTGDSILTTLAWRVVAQKFQTKWRAHVARCKVRRMKKAKKAKELRLAEKKRKAMDLVRSSRSREG